MKLSSRIVLAVACSSHSGAAWPPSRAQGLTGQISGTVTDTGGGVMPGATVTVKNAGTNPTRDTVTGADGAFLFPDLLAGTYDLTVTVAGLQDLRAEGHRARRPPSGSRCAPSRSKSAAWPRPVTVQAESVQVQTTNGARSGLDHARATSTTSRSRAATSRHAQAAARRHRHAPTAKRRAGAAWAASRSTAAAAFNFSYDGVTNKDTGSNSGNYAAPALDSIAEVRVQTSNFQAEYGRSSGATITVVTAQRHEGLPRQRGVLQARRLAERQRVLAPAAVRPGHDRTVRSAALQVRQHGLDARRAGAHSRAPDFNKGRNKLFFFWSQDLLPRTDPGDAQSAPDADRARAQGRLLADVRQRRASSIFIRDPLLAGTCSVDTGGPGLLPRQHHPGEPHRPGRRRRCSTCSRCRTRATRRARRSTTTSSRPCRTGRATTRCCAWTGTSRRRHDVLRARCSSATRSAPAACRCSAPPARLAAAAEQVPDRHGQLRQHAAAHVQPDARSPSSRSA